MHLFKYPWPKVYAVIFLVILIFVRSFVNFPSLTWRAEFWAESGMNFFCNALKPFSWRVFGVLDSGYLALLPRFLSFLTVTVMGFRDFAPHAQQLAALFVMAICASTLLNVEWGEQKRSLLLRVSLASILLLHWGYGMYVFNNVSYFTVIPVMSFLGFSIADLNRHWRWLFCMMPLLILNKPYLLTFAPSYFLFAAYLLKNRAFKASLPFILALVLIAVQLTIAFLNRNTFSGSSTANFDLQSVVNHVKTAGFFFLYAYENLFTGFYTKIYSFEIRSAIAVILLGIHLLMICWCFYKKIWWAVWFAVVSLATAFLCELMTAVVFFPGFNDFNAIPSFIDDSHHFFAFYLIFLSKFALLCRLVKQPHLIILIVLVCSACSNVIGFWKVLDPVPNLYPLPTRWEQQRELFHLGDGHIQINPDGRSFSPKACMEQPL